MGQHKHKKQTAILLPRWTKSAATIWIIIGAVALIAAVDYFQRSRNPPLTQSVPARNQGEPQAPLKIVEFVDFQCQHCALGYKILKEAMEKHPGTMFVTMKYYPLGELNSMRSALYAECAARQNKFWEYADELFINQAKWRALMDAYPYLESAAKKKGLDVTELKACTQKEDVKAYVLSEKTIGDSNFVKSTPTYFINKKIVVGPQELEIFLQDYFKPKETP